MYVEVFTISNDSGFTITSGMYEFIIIQVVAIK
jgi:hypothetical protein